MSPDSLPPELEGAEVLGERTLGSLGPVSVVRVSPETAAQLFGPRGRPVPTTIGLRPVVADSEHGEEAARLLREDALALAGLDHPNLVRILGLTRRGREEFAAVEIPEGDDLASLVSRRQFPLERVTAVACEVARALGALAEAGRPHKDFRLSCVFVATGSQGPGPKGPEGAMRGSPGGGHTVGGGGERPPDAEARVLPAEEVRVLPLAFPPEFRVEPRASKGSVYRGLPHYAAPELHAEGGAHPTEKSNIFAFGVAFFEMLTCQSPFRGGTPTRMLIDIRESAPPRPSSVVKDVPPELERICLRCLEKDPERRFPNFAAVEASLRIASETAPIVRRSPSTRAMPVATGPGGELPTARSRPPRAVLSRRQIAALAAAACVAAGALALAVLPRLEPLGEAARDAGFAEQILTKALAHVREGRFEEAWRLLEAHRSARDSSPAAYDDLHRRAASAMWLARAARAEEAARPSEAAQALDQAILLAEPGERDRLALRRDRALFSAYLARAEAAEGRSDWNEVRSALSSALALAGRLAIGAEETAALERRAEFAHAAALAADSRAAGDEASERKLLLQAALGVQGDPGAVTPGTRSARAAVMKRLEELGSGPEAARASLARAREALAAGDASEAERLAREASSLWPPLTLAEDLLAYIADWRSCEERLSVLVSPSPSEESWAHAGRPQAFCIQRYEFPGRAGETPETLVSAVEAAALCAARGERLCRLAEWQLACGGRESLVYPYGNEYRAGVCMTGGLSASPAGAHPECRSPFGVMDMSGNVAEWTSESVGTHVLVAGGDWSSGAALSRCASVTPFNPGLTSARVGFRCCRSLVAADAPSPGR